MDEIIPATGPLFFFHSFLFWGMDCDNEAHDRAFLDLTRVSFYVNLRTLFFVHADFFLTGDTLSCANRDCHPLSHFTSGGWTSNPARIRLAGYNKYNNNNVYLLLHLYFTLFRLWLTNRYLIVVRTALVFSFFSSFSSFSFRSRRNRHSKNFFEKSLLLLLFFLLSFSLPLSLDSLRS